MKKTSKRGFTLIKFIVIMIVIAIIAAIAVPALAGYIDEVRQRAYVAEARNIEVALQKIATEARGNSQHLPGLYVNANVTGPGGKPLVDEINMIIGTDFKGEDITDITLDIESAKLLKFRWHADSNRAVIFENDNFTVIYV